MSWQPSDLMQDSQYKYKDENQQAILEAIRLLKQRKHHTTKSMHYKTS